jgi:mitochondrial chaperone BCS1
LELGKAFSSSVPEDEFSAAELQGYLLTCKWDPERAVDGLSAWVDAQRRERAERVAREEKEREKRKAKKSAISGSIDRASVTGTRPTLLKE